MANRSIGLPLFIAIVAISFSAIFVKWSDAPASILSMYRMILASFFLLPIVWRKRSEFERIQRKDWMLLILSGLFLAFHFVLWFGSLKLTTVASSTIILALQPLVSLAGGFLLFRERTNAAALATMGIAIIGAVMIGWGDFGLSREAILGDLLSFLSVIAVVGYLLIGQQTVRKVSHWIYSFCVFSFAALFLFLFNLAASTQITGYSKHEWGIFLLLAIVPTIAHVINNWLMNYVNATTISMSILGEPVGATLLAVLLLNERLTSWQITGGIFILAGVFFFLLKQQPAHSKKSGSG
ncbi:DMT family transporter [Domibacillus sp. DTU_2020_1001157_1_SI_ALB_TIR_016]|uniref:DMT family transporter n=1 Tax=Domibacillus sp. DTU_2020_1001157_1_SI_ALB_TIR_016 TaxID=3077789 RepID=UPI0028E441B8|nr:DMT family transporter [Domibacillus sp. DTU_2020_1001157_1_SI_ALB_TIR_016]WNS80473.1 DMT family transporter [Domibacillus sp. DTU_2020_1001157_1_SI_ALB_TIR_016]